MKIDKIKAEEAEIRRLAGELNRLEIATDSFHSSTLWVVSVLFLLALAGFAGSVAFPDIPIAYSMVYGTIGAYLVLPVALYTFAMIYLRGKSRAARERIAEAQKRIAAAS